MAYQHESFSFPMEQPQPANMYFAQPMHYQPYMQQCPQPELVYNPYTYQDFGPDFFAPGMMPDEFDDAAEITTRPRLTKEQVDILESQFQAHPKPNSMVKKQLAMQTKLSLNRVANWFQNRRAKAKQQRRQEEFENSQNNQNGENKSEGNLDSKDDEKDDDDEDSISAPAVLPPSAISSEPIHRATESSPSRSPVKAEISQTDASWASLQRALGQAKAAQQQAMVQQRAQEEAMLAMPPPEIPRQPQTAPLPLRSPHPIHANSFDWTNKESMFDAWTSSPTAAASDIPFDFGFDTDYSSSHHSTTSEASPSEHSQHAYMTNAAAWDSSLTTPTQAVHQHSQGEFGPLIQSPALPMPSYPSSRRGSAAEILAANFESFALASGSPNQMPPSVPLRRPETEIDLAARRKRPRPAALTSASLRSRSYGALTSVSPTFKGMSPGSAQTIRHVKSQGHGLNSHYAGIRKASAAQKSPLNMATFAEAESFKRLMAQRATEAAANTNQNTPTNAQHNVRSSAGDYVSHIANLKSAEMNNQMREIMTEYHKLQSPPVTPFQQEFLTHSTVSGVPVSTATQYATFNDYTPPYSAGPLTNSSWSDAPLTSPDLAAAFPPVTYIPSLTHAHHTDDLSVVQQNWMLPSDHTSDVNINTVGDKKTEFFIQEFPNQKEEHAHVAQQLAQQRPKHYVFANSKPSDYGE